MDDARTGFGSSGQILLGPSLSCVCREIRARDAAAATESNSEHNVDWGWRHGVSVRLA
jgi:hypothetical protein